MSKLILGLIGCGAVASRYYVPALKKYAGEIQLYCVDKQKDKAEKIRNLIGKAEVSDSYQEVLNHVDGAIIALPHMLHYPVSMDFLKAKAHVLCEKPLTQKKEHASELIEIAKKNGVSLCVNNTRRMFPSFNAVREIINSGDIGKIQSIKYIEGSVFAWADSTGFYVDPKITDKGILLDLGAHVLDTICWWLGQKPKILSIKDDSFGGPESVVSINAELRECKIEIFLNRLNDLESYFLVSGHQGSVYGHPFNWNDLKIKNGVGTRQIKLNEKFRSIPEFVEKITDNFIEVIKGERQPLITGEDVFDSICMLEECYDLRKRFQLSWYKNMKTQDQFSGKILVTGASGFVGGRVVERIYLSGAGKVKAGIRKWASAARIGRFPVEICQLDITDKSQIDEALKDVTYVIHCAYGSGGATVEGTRNLLEKCMKMKIERFVHLSTTEIYGDVFGNVDESFPHKYTGNEYNRDKIDAEKSCWEYIKKGLPVTILRPHIIYGPFNRNWTLNLANLFLQGKWGLYENYGAGRCNLIYIDDLINAIILSLKEKGAIGEAFNVSGPDIISWNDYFAKYNDMMGLPPLSTIQTRQAATRSTVLAPIRLVGRIFRNHFMSQVKILANYSEILKNVMVSTERLLKTVPSMETLKLFNKDAVFLSKKAEDILGFQPQYSIDNGLEITVSWLRHHGFFNDNDGIF